MIAGAQRPMLICIILHWLLWLPECAASHCDLFSNRGCTDCPDRVYGTGGTSRFKSLEHPRFRFCQDDHHQGQDTSSGWPFGGWQAARQWQQDPVLEACALQPVIQSGHGGQGTFVRVDWMGWHLIKVILILVHVTVRRGHVEPFPGANLCIWSNLLPRRCAEEQWHTENEWKCSSCHQSSLHLLILLQSCCMHRMLLPPHCTVSSRTQPNTDSMVCQYSDKCSCVAHEVSKIS